MKLKKFEDYNSESDLKNLIKGLTPEGEETEDDKKIISDFDKFNNMIDELISKFNSEKVVGNTLSDLGNFIGQNIYKYIDENDSSFSSADFISGFKHGVDSMKEPSKSKYHNFK